MPSSVTTSQIVAAIQGGMVLTLPQGNHAKHSIDLREGYLDDLFRTLAFAILKKRNKEYWTMNKNPVWTKPSARDDYWEVKTPALQFTGVEPDDFINISFIWHYRDGKRGYILSKLECVTTPSDSVAKKGNMSSSFTNVYSTPKAPNNRRELQAQMEVCIDKAIEYFSEYMEPSDKPVSSIQYGEFSRLESYLKAHPALGRVYTKEDKYFIASLDMAKLIEKMPKGIKSKSNMDTAVSVFLAEVYQLEKEVTKFLKVPVRAIIDLGEPRKVYKEKFITPYHNPDLIFVSSELLYREKGRTMVSLMGIKKNMERGFLNTTNNSKKLGKLKEYLEGMFYQIKEGDNDSSYLKY